MNLEARTWIVDVQATTALDHIYPVFLFLNFDSSGDIRFCSGILIQSSSRLIFPVIIRPVSTSPPQGGARCPFRARELGFVLGAHVFAPAWGFAREVFYCSAFDPSAFAFCLASIVLQICRFPSFMPAFPSLICGSDRSRTCRSRHSLECSVVFRSSFEVFCRSISSEAS